MKVIAVDSEKRIFHWSTGMMKTDRSNVEKSQMSNSHRRSRTDEYYTCILILRMLSFLDENERVGNYEQTSIRYTGKHIPSPSFRVLQRFADEAQEYGRFKVDQLNSTYKLYVKRQRNVYVKLFCKV